MSLRIHRLAVAEIDHEVDYYEGQRPSDGRIMVTRVVT